MSGQAPPAIPHYKHQDRVALLKDAHYFAGEFMHRLEALIDSEPDGDVLIVWGQALAWLGRFRGLLRGQLGLQRERDRRRGRL